jgi:hypothetical protein
MLFFIAEALHADGRTACRFYTWEAGLLYVSRSAALGVHLTLHPLV